MITLEHIVSAADRILPYVYRTPILFNEKINRLVAGQVSFKCENLQRTGAFKMRGAANFCMEFERDVLQHGVATHSSGNHGRALACMARLLDTPAYIVMPEDAPKSKIEGVKSEGAVIVFCKPGLQNRETALAEVMEKHGAVFVPPYNHESIMAGQGTAVYEALNSNPLKPDVVITPVGGGGLLSGSAVAAKSLVPAIKVYGAEPAGADDAHRSLHHHERIIQQTPVTIADGLRTTLGDKTYEVIQKNVDDIFLTSEEGIAKAMKLLINELKLVVEPSAAVPLAAMLENPYPFAGKRTLMVLSGGNTDSISINL
jgi:threonine dehydratase